MTTQHPEPAHAPSGPESTELERAQAGALTPQAAQTWSTPPAQPDGSAAGYRTRRTLSLRVELARQLRRRRTRGVLGFLAVLPVLLLVAFEIGGQQDGAPNSFATDATSNGLNFTLFAAHASTGLLLIVVLAVFFGDTVASEATWASLRYLLIVPVPRARLLRQKALASAVLSMLAVGVLLGVSLAVGLLWYGSGSLTAPTGEALALPSGLLSLLLTGVYLLVHLSWVAGLALYMSVRFDTPLGAVGATVLVSVLSQILDQISALGPARSYLPTHYATAFVDLVRPDLYWTNVAWGAFSGLAYAAVFGCLAVGRFQRIDVTS